MALFGHALTPERPLSQPGQFLSRERVTVKGPKGEFQNVAVLGPERKAGQVEISLTDCRQLGLSAPVRLSGDIGGTPGALLLGPRGTVQLREGVIVARRHVHLTPEAAFGLDLWCRGLCPVLTGVITVAPGTCGERPEVRRWGKSLL